MSRENHISLFDSPIDERDMLFRMISTDGLEFWCKKLKTTERKLRMAYEKGVVATDLYKSLRKAFRQWRDGEQTEELFNKLDILNHQNKLKAGK